TNASTLQCRLLPGAAWAATAFGRASQCTTGPAVARNHDPTATVTIALPKTLAPSHVTVIATSALAPSSATLRTVPDTTSTAGPSAGTTTGPANRIEVASTRSAPPAHRATSPIARAEVSIPCATTPGNPGSRAASSRRWIGLWSPDASAYLRRSARVIST